MLVQYSHPFYCLLLYLWILFQEAIWVCVHSIHHSGHFMHIHALHHVDSCHYWDSVLIHKLVIFYLLLSLQVVCILFKHFTNPISFCLMLCVNSCNCIFSYLLGAISLGVCAVCGDMYIGHWWTGGSWYKSPTASTHVSPQLPSAVPFNAHIVWFIDWKCFKPTMLISSVIGNIMYSNFNCILLLFSQLGLDL